MDKSLSDVVSQTRTSRGSHAPLFEHAVSLQKK